MVALFGLGLHLRTIFTVVHGLHGFADNAAASPSGVAELILYLLEHSHQRAVARNGECQRGFGADFAAALGPAHELIALVGDGLQGGVFAIVVCAITVDAAALCGVRRSAEGGGGIGLELGCYGYIAAHILICTGVVGTPIVPLQEVVAIFGLGLHLFAIFAVFYSLQFVADNAAACPSAVAELILYLFEHSHQRAVARNAEAVFRFGVHYGGAIFPAFELVSLVGRCGERCGCALVVGACTVHAAALGGLGAGINGKGDDVLLELGSYVYIAAHILICTGVVGAFVAPPHKVVVRIGLGLHLFAIFAVFYSLQFVADNAAACPFGVAELILYLFELGHQRAVARSGECQRGFGADCAAALGPVHELIALVGGGAERGGGV